MNIRTIEQRDDGAVVLIDQRKLPTEETYVTCESWEEVAEAIRDMVVRGAPAIGVTAGYGAALAARALSSNGADTPAFVEKLGHVLGELGKSRPTAVNLSWALDRMQRVIDAHLDADPPTLAKRLDQEARKIHLEDQKTCADIGRHGAPLIPTGARVLTHCNTGALATAGIGTALGVVRTAAEKDDTLHVWADETRPWLQGARLTTWECQKEGIPVSLIPDSVAADLMRRGQVDLVIVGADRIAANGDTANKIGTYAVAVAAHHHGVPFYIAAPRSTIDMSLATGADIPIEERSSREVTHVGERAIAPDGVRVFNPAFDVTPARLIHGIITEVGVARPPYGETLAALWIS